MFIRFSLITFFIFSQVGFSQKKESLETFLFCKNKLNIINNSKCSFQKIPHMRAKKLSRIEAKNLSCGKSKIIGIVTRPSCIKSKYREKPPANTRVAPEFIQSSLTMKKMLNIRTHNRDH